MRIAKIPNGDYYLEKDYSRFVNPFTFAVKPFDSGEKGQIAMLGKVVSVPKEFVGKRICFKVELLEDNG